VPLLHRYDLARTGSRSRAEEVGTACGGGATSGGPCELNAAAGRGANSLSDSGLDRGRYRPTTAGAVDRRAINSRVRCQHRRPVVGAVALFARARQRPPHLSLSVATGIRQRAIDSVLFLRQASGWNCTRTTGSFPHNSVSAYVQRYRSASVFL
jgi:hypothetical protein